MAQPDDLEARVAALETQVQELSDRVRISEHDAAAARVLAGGADRDVSEIRGEIRETREQTTRVLNAMREEFTDLRHDFTDLRQDFTDLGQRVDSGFAEMRGRLDAAAGQQQITDLLTTLIDRQGDEPNG